MSLLNPLALQKSLNSSIGWNKHQKHFISPTNDCWHFRKKIKYLKYITKSLKEYFSFYLPAWRYSQFVLHTNLISIKIFLQQRDSDQNHLFSMNFRSQEFLKSLSMNEITKNVISILTHAFWEKFRLLDKNADLRESLFRGHGVRPFNKRIQWSVFESLLFKGI